MTVSAGLWIPTRAHIYVTTNCFERSLDLGLKSNRRSRSRKTTGIFGRPQIRRGQSPGRMPGTAAGTMSWSNIVTNLQTLTEEANCYAESEEKKTSSKFMRPQTGPGQSPRKMPGISGTISCSDYESAFTNFGDIIFSVAKIYFTLD